MGAKPKYGQAYPIQYCLKPLGYSTRNEIAGFHDMLCSIAIQLRQVFEYESCLMDEGFRDRMHYASRGDVDSVMGLVRQAAIVAIKREADKLEMVDFAEAYDWVVRLNKGTEVSPFVIDDFTFFNYPNTV